MPFLCRTHRPWLGFALAILLLTLAGALSPQTSAAAAEVKELSVSATDFDTALAGKQTYNFVVVSADEIIDWEGRHFAPKDIKKYLRKAKPEKNAAYVIWIPNPRSLDIAKAAIAQFVEYGATVFAVREMNKAAASQLDSAPGKLKTLVLVGQPNPKSLRATDQPPDMRDRPVHLRPGPLPRRVRYQFKADALVVAAADRVSTLLLGPGPTDGAVLPNNSMSMLGVGAWKHLSRLPALQAIKPIFTRVELGRGVVQLETGFLSTPEQRTAVIAEVRRLIADDYGGTLRALRTDEMERWWTFIGFDIEEPTFVIETKGGKYRFVVMCSDDNLFGFDELNALPSD